MFSKYKNKKVLFFLLTLLILAVILTFKTFYNLFNGGTFGIFEGILCIAMIIILIIIGFLQNEQEELKNWFLGFVYSSNQDVREVNKIFFDLHFFGIFVLYIVIIISWFWGVTRIDLSKENIIKLANTRLLLIFLLIQFCLYIEWCIKIHNDKNQMLKKFKVLKKELVDSYGRNWDFIIEIINTTIILVATAVSLNETQKFSSFILLLVPRFFIDIQQIVIKNIKKNMLYDAINDNVVEKHTQELKRFRIISARLHKDSKN